MPDGNKKSILSTKYKKEKKIGRNQGREKEKNFGRIQNKLLVANGERWRRPNFAFYVRETTSYGKLMKGRTNTIHWMENEGKRLALMKNLKTRV